MATSTIYGLNLPPKGEQDWDVPLNANFEEIDTGMACARTHYRVTDLPFSSSIVLKPSIGRSMLRIHVTDNITSMSIDWSDFETAKNIAGDRFSFELRIHPSSGVSIVWPSNVIWMNNSVPMLNGTKTLRIVFEKHGTTNLGSFMGWEG